MPAARIIPCLDVRDGRVVKGVQFRDHRDAGDILEHALRYRDEGADELVFYDIGASAEDRGLDMAWVFRIGAIIDIPFAVAGGIRTRGQAEACLEAGADKVSINSPALERPELIDALARDFGNQCIVLGVDSYARDGAYFVHQYTGRPDKSRDTGRNTLDWAREAVDRGAGEIVLNCMRRDGVRSGYDLDHVAATVEAVTVPVIASGGAGQVDDFAPAIEAGADAVLAASVFHFGEISIAAVKTALRQAGHPVR